MPDRADNPFAVSQSLTSDEGRPPAAAAGSFRITTLALRIGSLLAFLLYSGFTLLLLWAGPADRSAGYAFLGNAVLLLAMTIASWASLQTAFFFGCSTIIVQTVITLLLLATGGSLTRILLINGAILLPLLSLTLLARHLARTSHSPPAPRPPTPDN